MAALHPTTTSIVANVERVLLGKTDAVKLCVAALLAHGHVLIEDVPGVGKTMLARSLAVSIGADFKRIQFTPDLLPGDITGVQIFNQTTHQFEFHPGPILTQVLLADEINRATPKTQSALLESMEERRITIDGTTLPLPEPFIVLATRNPGEFEGTYPLPESQLDRFTISLRLGYPDRAHEYAMLAQLDGPPPLDALTPVMPVDELLALQRQVQAVYVDDLVREYLLSVVEASRRHPDIRLGASPRATVALFRMTQAWALVAGREYAYPDDVKAVAPAVLRHRLVPEDFGAGVADQLAAELLRTVPVPGNRG